MSAFARVSVVYGSVLLGFAAGNAIRNRYVQATHSGCATRCGANCIPPF